VYCHRAPEWPQDPDVVERVPVRSCARSGAAIDLVPDRGRENRPHFVITGIRGGREAIFWQSPRTTKQARPSVGLPAGRAQGAELTVLVDSHERYPYTFARQSGRGHVDTVRRGPPAGDYAVELDGRIAVAVERKSLADLSASLLSGKLRYAMAELTAPPRAAVVVEDRYSRLFALEHVRPWVVADALAEAQLRCPGVPIGFAETRPLAEEWHPGSSPRGCRLSPTTRRPWSCPTPGHFRRPTPRPPTCGPGRVRRGWRCPTGGGCGRRCGGPIARLTDLRPQWVRMRILYVCTANICRSPAAAALLRDLELPGVEVRSAGTHAVPGSTGCPLAPALSGRFEEHSSRVLTGELVGWADLVLTAAREHRSAVIQWDPSARQRTYTLRQVGRLAEWLVESEVLEVARQRAADPGSASRFGEEDPRRFVAPLAPGEELLWLTGELDAARGVVPTPVGDVVPKRRRWWQREAPAEAEHPDDIPDPHVLGSHLHDVAHAEIVQSTRALAQILGGLLADSPHG
jgi:protein-tyrosine-phosphatase